MDAIAVRIRQIAREAELTTEEVRTLLRSDREGDRVVGLAIVQATAEPDLFDDVFQFVRQPKTPFEQYHALRAIESLRPSLHPTELSQVSSLLTDVDWRKALAEDASRVALADRTLEAIRQDASFQTPRASEA
jgi:hypothetical protein